MNATEQKVTLASGEIGYYVLGEGRPLLYLHPAGGVRWSVVLATLAKTYKVHVPVIPGFDGSTVHPGLDSMKGLGKLAGEFVDAVIGSKCDVIGHSFGGWVSLWLTVQRPELVDHLVLEASAGFRPKGVGGAPSTPEALKKALFAHPEKIPPGGKTMDVEAANSKMRAHYTAARETDDELLALLPVITSSTLILQGTEDLHLGRGAFARSGPARARARRDGKLPRAFGIVRGELGHDGDQCRMRSAGRGVPVRQDSARAPRALFRIFCCGVMCAASRLASSPRNRSGSRR